MYLHISSSLSLSNHPWFSQNENCILVNSPLPLIRAFWDTLISLFWSPQNKYGFPSKHLTSLVTEYLLVLRGSVYHRGGSIYHYSILTGGSLYHGGQNTISHRHNECCAGLQYQPRQRRPYKWSISILPRSQFYKKQGKLAFSTSCTAVRPHRRLRNDAWRRDS